jgi:hypothetical protein
MHLSFLVQGNFSILFGKSMVQLTKKQWMTMQCYQFPVIVLCISLHFVRYGRGNAPNLLLVRLVHPNYMFKNSIHIIFPMLSILSSSFSLYCFLYADLALSHQRSESPLFFSFPFYQKSKLHGKKADNPHVHVTRPSTFLCACFMLYKTKLKGNKRHSNLVS